MSHVVDASALLAWLQGEPGSGRVAAVLDGAMISAVNWSEVLAKAQQKGVQVGGLQEDLADIGLSVVAFDARQAELAAGLWWQARRHGLSLADRACLALGLARGATVLTVDRRWLALDLEFPIQAVR